MNASLRAGYKQTEVGVIPEDWGVRTIKEFASVKGGKRLPQGWLVVDNPTPHPYLRVTDMRQGKVDLSDIKYVPEEAFPPIRNYRIYSEDIFISVAGSLGIVGKIPPELDGANLTENADKITAIECDRDYLLFYLMSDRVQGIIEAERTVGAQPKLALGRIENFVVPLPPTKAEQEAIAEALSDADALIESLEQLVAKKRHLKQGTMQELLTGKKRLPGFSGEYSLKRLSDMATLSKTGLNPASTPDTLFIHFSLPAFDDGAMPVAEFGSLIGSNKFSVPSDAVLLSKLNPRIPRVWAPSEIPNNSVCSTEFLVLIPRESTSRGFLAALCRSPVVCYQMELHAIGTTGSHQRIHPAQALAIEVAVPADKAEQAAIAETLSDMDAEIAKLETQLAKIRTIKQGMMHKLLTGEIRLL